MNTLVDQPIMAAAANGRRFNLILAIGALSLILLTALIAINFRAISEFSRLVPELESLQKREELLRGITENVFEMQAARRGFILTGDAQFFQRLEVSAQQAASRMRGLRDSFKHHGASERETNSRAILLLELVGRYETQLRTSVALRRDRPNALPEQQALTLDGEESSRVIHEKLNELEAEMEKQFDRDTRSLLANTGRLQQSQTLLAAVGLILLATAYLVAASEARRRSDAQRALAEVNSKLEEKVLARTAAAAAGALRYRRLVEASADGILLCDADRSIVYANPAALALLQQKRLDAVQGRPISALFGPDDASWLADWLQPLWLAPHQQMFREANIFNAAGRAVAVRLGAVSYLDRGVLQAQIILHDMTQLRASERAIKDQLLFIDQLFKAIPAPLSVRDERGRYLRVNHAYEIAYRCQQEQINQRSMFNVLPYDLATCIAQQDSAAMHGAETLVFENRVSLPDMPVSDYLTRTCAVRRADGSVIGVISVDADVTEIRRKEAELRRINSELETLSQRLIHSQENERRRIARDLHDQVGQILTALKMSLQLARAQAGSPAVMLDNSIEMADEALKHTRSLTASLHPHMLEDLGLDAAVRSLADKFARPALKTVKLDIMLHPARGDPAHELVAYRLVQESLTNVIRHAEASSLKVSLQTRNGMLHIVVADDGKGFETGASWFDLMHSASLGIASMRERVAEVGGDLSIESADGQGTVIRAVLPW